MPLRASRPCKHGGCRALAATGSRFCSAHANQPAATRPYDKWRGSPASRGYDADWRRVRKLALERDHHLCQDCLAAGRLTPAAEVHHEVPIELDRSRRLDLTNLRCLCKPCHSAITAVRDSNFARSGRQV